ncbi:hypothetical protein [Citrobacter sp. Cpo113]|uniref:hypothetical protein n=1 Tax=Citrobacter sp. Cpo113 TaxID=2985146 RepID=UPI002577C1E9|nr:hypothetical protein [Citrobacter sp. Cpo113]MDM2789459.1 hypothetical protein [Citrobacter sp. Cpo113]
MQAKKASGKREPSALKRVSGKALPQKAVKSPHQKGYILVATPGVKPRSKALSPGDIDISLELLARGTSFSGRDADPGVRIVPQAFREYDKQTEFRKWEDVVLTAPPDVFVTVKLPKLSVEEATVLSKRMFAMSLSDMQDELYDDAE